MEQKSWSRIFGRGWGPVPGTINRKTTRVVDVSTVLAWQLPEEHAPLRGTFTISDEPVLPLKFDPDNDDQCAELWLTFSRGDRSYGKVEVTSIQFTTAFSRRTVRVGPNDPDQLLRVLEPEPGKVRCLVRVHKLLEALEVHVNRNLISADMTFKLSDGDSAEERGIQTQFPLHVMLQRLVVLLPGVMGSSIWVRRGAMRLISDDIQCWPTLETTNALESLMCHADGTPREHASWLRGVALAPPLYDWLASAIGKDNKGTKPQLYDREQYQEWLDEDCPKLMLHKAPKKKGKSRGHPVRVHHYPVQLYPYDWRLHFNHLIEKLCGQDLSQLLLQEKHEEARYRKMIFWNNPMVQRHWSLRTLVTLYQKKERYQFLSSRVTLAGHSTGGVIINGLIRQRDVGELVDSAYFIATPFKGSYKAFYALLKGTMDLGSLTEAATLGSVLDLVSPCSEFSKLAQTLPVIYGLATTHAYDPDRRVLFAKYHEDERNVRESYMNDLESCMGGVLYAIGDPPALQWNEGLWNQAATYHDFCNKNPINERIQCRAYYSELLLKGSPNSTYGPLKINIAKRSIDPIARIDSEQIPGDGTVFTESLRGPFHDEQSEDLKLEQIDHGAVVNSEKMWKDIGQRLTRRYPERLRGEDGGERIREDGGEKIREDGGEKIRGYKGV